MTCTDTQHIDTHDCECLLDVNKYTLAELNLCLWLHPKADMLPCINVMAAEDLHPC